MGNPTEDLGQFYDYFWRNTEGWVYTPVLQDEEWRPLMFRWPAKRAGVISHTLKHAADPHTQVYFSPALFSTTSARKDGVLGSWSLWADYDGNAPSTWADMDVPTPTLRVQSSTPGHEHVYWRLNRFLTDVNVLEERNRAIAKLTGADTSGWDADQVLRPIHTLNRKRATPQPVIVLAWEV